MTKTCKQCNRPAALHWAVPLCQRCLRRNRRHELALDIWRGQAEFKYAGTIVIGTLLILALFGVWLRRTFVG